MDDKTIAQMMEVMFQKWRNEGKINTAELIEIQKILWRL